MTNWTKHTGTTKPEGLADAQMIEWRVNNGPALVDPAGNLNWAAELYSGSAMYWRPALDDSGVPYCSAEGLPHWVKWVAYCPHEGVIYASNDIEWHGDGWRPVHGCTFSIGNPETHRKPGDPADSLMRVWRENANS